MNSSQENGTQLSLINDARPAAPCLTTNARMALNVLDRLLEDNAAVTSQASVFFKAIFPAVVAAAERAEGLPITKTTLRPQLLNPAAAITRNPPKRADEFMQMERLMEFVQHRLATPEDKARVEQQVEALLSQRNPEMLITPEGMASQLLAAERHDATLIFRPLLGSQGTDTSEALIEAYVLLRANNADVQTGIANLFWSQNTGSASAEHYIEGCADGQARAFFRTLLALPEEKQQQIFSTINLETFYAALGN